MQQLRLSGSGGQGVITAAIILAEAAVSEGKEALQSQSYGPAARGGSSKAEVIISDKPIYYPKVIAPEFVLAMTQQAADKYYGDMAPSGTLIIDEDLVPQAPPVEHIIRIPITRLAVEQVGKPLFANIVALGALVKITGFVDFATIQAAVAKRVPRATIDQNMLALQVGYDAVK